MQEPMMSVKEVAEMLNISIYTVYRLKDQPHGIKAYKVGGSVRFKRSDVDNYLSGRAVVPVVPAPKFKCERFKYVPGMKVV